MYYTNVMFARALQLCRTYTYHANRPPPPPPRTVTSPPARPAHNDNAADAEYECIFPFRFVFVFIFFRLTSYNIYISADGARATRRRLVQTTATGYISVSSSFFFFFCNPPPFVLFSYHCVYIYLFISAHHDIRIYYNNVASQSYLEFEYSNFFFLCIQPRPKLCIPV